MIGKASLLPRSRVASCKRVTRGRDSDLTRRSVVLIDSKRGSGEKAISLLERSIELDPNLGEAYSLLASVYDGFARTREAQELHVKALQVSPWNADFVNNYAVFLQSNGTCLSLRPRNP